MIDFNFVSPTKIIFGKDKENQVGSYIKSYGFKNVLLVYGGSHALKSGLIDRVRTSLEDEGIDYAELSGVQPNPVRELVEAGKEMAIENKCDFILAVGGGSAIDTAKSIAVNVYYDGDVMDFNVGKATPSKALPIGVILTIAAAGSELSDSCVISDEEKQIKAGFHNDIVRPLFAIENPELTYSCPKYQTGAGIIDMISHSLERYMCPSSELQYSDSLALAVIKEIINAAKVVNKDPNNYDARGALMVLSGLAHNGLTYLAKKNSMVCHGAEHALSAFDPKITHGAGIGVCYLGWSKAYLKEMTPKLAASGRYLFDIKENDDIQAAKMHIQAMQNFIKELGMPTGLVELGIKEEDLDKLSDLATKNDTRKIGLAPYPLDKEGVRKIYEHCLNEENL